MPLYEFDPTNYEPNFIQPYTAASFNRQDIRERWDTLGVPYVLKGDHVTSLPGEEWDLPKCNLAKKDLKLICLGCTLVIWGVSSVIRLHLVIMDVSPKQIYQNGVMSSMF